LITIVGDVGNEESAATILKTIQQKCGGPNHVIASIGSWWQKGLLSKQSLSEFNGVMHNLVGAHFVCAKTFLPVLTTIKGSSYTIISGAAGERIISEDSSLVTVCASALFGLSMVLRHEYEKAEVRVNEYRIASMVKKTKAEVTQKWHISSDDIARVPYVLAQSSCKVRGQVFRAVNLGDIENVVTLAKGSN